MTAAVILAGGLGRRIGGNKPFYPYRGSTLVETVITRLAPQTPDLYINAASLNPALENLSLPMTYDDPLLVGLGPLSGVLSALALARRQDWPAIATVPCDMPHLPLDLLAQLTAAPSTDVVHFTGARDYPLCALWKASLFNRLYESLAAAQPSGGLAVRRFLDDVQVCRLVTTDDAAFANINHAPA